MIILKIKRETICSYFRNFAVLFQEQMTSDTSLGFRLSYFTIELFANLGPHSVIISNLKSNFSLKPMKNSTF